MAVQVSILACEPSNSPQLQHVNGHGSHGSQNAWEYKSSEICFSKALQRLGQARPLHVTDAVLQGTLRASVQPCTITATMHLCVSACRTVAFRSPSTARGYCDERVQPIRKQNAKSDTPTSHSLVIFQTLKRHQDGYLSISYKVTVK